MDQYIIWVMENPLLSAAIQFALLGTAGEIISLSLRKKSLAIPGGPVQLLGKIIAWAILGIVIKYGFTGMKGFTRALLDHRLLPAVVDSGLGWALAVSVVTNLFFGPQMMFIHRLEDNLIDRRWNMAGLTTAWWTLLWFWIPAHTVTFSLQTEYQIGLAAVWSLVLGLIMGYAKRESPER